MFSFVWVLKFINLTLRSLLQTKLQEQATQKQHTSHRSNDHDDTHCQVTGEEKRGRMHMLGLGPSPADLLGQKLSRSSHTKMALETKGSPNEKVSKMSNKMEAMEQKFASLEAQIGRMTSHLQNLVDKMAGASGTKQVQYMFQLDFEAYSLVLCMTLLVHF